MVMISLRDYYREIESLIEAAQNNEAIFHCMVILQSFPKSIETYRKLGKALLESKRYAEAAEVFSKILTVFPDDFITHVGLSVIKEEERDLDAAIWHMEQAFELQPSNLALQEELRRLFGRRDGVPPTKIRLTRGALVKMYARGELHQQAIAEIKSVLKDEPTRVDYQALLAKMYMVSGAHTDAVEIASTIIGNYPYCFDANRILDELLANTETLEGINIYRERLVEVDPYYKFVDALTPNVADVPSEKVILEKISYSGSTETESGVSDWAKQIDLNWKPKDVFVDSGTFDLLDQVDAFSGEAKEPVFEQPISPFIGEVIPELDNQPENNEKEPVALPDWIANAGWTRSTESSNAEIEKNISMASEEETLEPAVPSQELPDWLRSLGASDDLENSKLNEKDLSSEPNEENPDTIPDDEKSTDSTSEELPEWLTSLSPGEKPDLSHEEIIENESLPIENDEPVVPSEELPDWLKTLAPAEESAEEHSFEDEARKIPADNNDLLSRSDELPEWLKSLSDEEQSKIESTFEQNESLSSVSESGAEDDHSPLSSEEMKEAIENWVEESDSVAELEMKNEDENQADGQSSDWLNQFITPKDSAKSEPTNEKLPEWLKGFGSEEAETSAEKADQPDWLSSLQDHELDSEEVTIEKGPVDSETPTEPEIINNIDDILDGIKFDQPESEEEQIHVQYEETLPQTTSEDSNQFEELVTDKEELESKPTIPSWVRNILGTSTPVDSEPVTGPVSNSEEELKTLQTDESPEISNLQANEEEMIEPLISDLPNKADHIGAISGNSKDELLSWLREVDPSIEALPDEINEPESSVKEVIEPQKSELSSIEDLVRDSLTETEQSDAVLESSAEEILEPDFTDRLSELLEQPVDENISLEEIEESTHIASEDILTEKNVDQIVSELAIEAEESELSIDKNSHPLDQPTIEPDPLQRIGSVVESGDFTSLSMVIDEIIANGSSREKIIESVESLSQKEPNSYEIWRELGDLYLAESDFDKALKAYNIAERILQI